MKSSTTLSTAAHEDGAITRLLRQWKSGDGAALDQLTPIIYNDLLRIAKARLREESYACTIQPTALVHEAYIRLAGQSELHAENRAHFYAIAANTMRRVLVEHARHRQAQKRDGGIRVTLHADLNATHEAALDVFLLDSALRRLTEADSRKGRVIEMKYFGGLTTQEIALVEKISVATVGRELRIGQAWLRREMSPARE